MRRSRRRREPSPIRELAVLRKVEPDETVIITLDRHTSQDEVDRITWKVRTLLGCRVIVLPAGAEVLTPKESTP